MLCLRTQEKEGSLRQCSYGDVPIRARMPKKKTSYCTVHKNAGTRAHRQTSTHTQHASTQELAESRKEVKVLVVVEVVVAVAVAMVMVAMQMVKVVLVQVLVLVAVALVKVVAAQANARSVVKVVGGGVMRRAGVMSVWCGAAWCCWLWWLWWPLTRRWQLR